MKQKVVVVELILMGDPTCVIPVCEKANNAAGHDRSKSCLKVEMHS